MKASRWGGWRNFSSDFVRMAPFCDMLVREDLRRSEIKAIVEEQMRLDDETMAFQLYRLLTEKGYNLTRRTVLRCRTELGWMFRASSYCQLIREANKEKRLDWARRNRNDTFEDVVWSDESTIQLETHQQFCGRKENFHVTSQGIMCTY